MKINIIAAVGGTRASGATGGLGYVLLYQGLQVHVVRFRQHQLLHDKFQESYELHLIEDEQERIYLLDPKLEQKLQQHVPLSTH